MLNSQTWLQGVLKTQTSKTQTSDLENADLENTDLKLKCRPWKHSARNIKCQIESEQSTFRGLCFWGLWSAFSRSVFSRHPMATSSTTKYIPVYNCLLHICGTLAHNLFSLHQMVYSFISNSTNRKKVSLRMVQNFVLVFVCTTVTRGSKKLFTSLCPLQNLLTLVFQNVVAWRNKILIVAYWYSLFQLYSLLSFISPNIFSFDAVEEFLERYAGVFNCAGNSKLIEI